MWPATVFSPLLGSTCNKGTSWYFLIHTKAFTTLISCYIFIEQPRWPVAYMNSSPRQAILDLFLQPSAQVSTRDIKEKYSNQKRHFHWVHVLRSKRTSSRPISPIIGCHKMIRKVSRENVIFLRRLEFRRHPLYDVGNSMFTSRVSLFFFFLLSSFFLFIYFVWLQVCSARPSQAQANCIFWYLWPSSCSRYAAFFFHGPPGTFSEWIQVDINTMLTTIRTTIRANFLPPVIALGALLVISFSRCLDTRWF